MLIEVLVRGATMSGTLEARSPLRILPSVRWRRRDLFLFVPVALAVGYLASPYVAIARLAYAVRVNDVGVLANAVDWGRVRAGLDQEVTSQGGADVRNAAATVPAASDDLPAFGQSFATDAMSNAIASAVTPSGLQTMLAQHRSGDVLSSIRSVVDGAVFIGLDRFELRLPTASGHGGDPLRIGFRFSARHGWRVERVVLPPDMLDGRDAQT